MPVETTVSEGFYGQLVMALSIILLFTAGFKNWGHLKSIDTSLLQSDLHNFDILQLFQDGFCKNGLLPLVNHDENKRYAFII